jgi:hypothetical protein
MNLQARSSPCQSPRPIPGRCFGLQNKIRIWQF